MTGNESFLPPGTVFNLPEVITRLPEACHGDCAQLDHTSDALARQYLVDYFGDEERADRYLRQRISHFACICYPYSSSERAQSLTNLMIPVTIFDDTFSRPDTQEDLAAATALHDDWCAVFKGHRPPPHGNSAFLLVYNAIEAAAARMSEHLAARVRQAWSDMAASHLDEAVLRNNNIALSYEQYMEKRLTNVYGWWLTTHVEYAKGIDLGELSNHPEIMAVRRAAINHVTLVNDLYSFPKELDAKEAMMNAILVLMRRENLNLQQSIDKVVDNIHQAELDFISARDNILQGQQGQLSDIGAYLDGVGYVMTGNLRWSQMSTRYFGDDHDGARITSGPITITPKPTVHAPAPRAEV
ncbi:hypothetical protein AK830_g4843 [Neonectria ditissima]|uniref:Terpene synthase n=1 Tax=Neonectria ditissima TaxID=78410 RepID=A0A0P7B5K9_9HYPO|nr:hypothetical protein AK830_g4843 [Neonectria ditissima]